MWVKALLLVTSCGMASCGGGSTSGGGGSDHLVEYDGSWRGAATSTDGYAGGTIALHIQQHSVTKKCDTGAGFGGSSYVNFIDCDVEFIQGLVAFPPCIPVLFFEGHAFKFFDGKNTLDGFALQTEFDRNTPSIWLEVVSDLPDSDAVAPIGTEMNGMYRYTAPDVDGCPAVDNGTITLVKTSDEI